MPPQRPQEELGLVRVNDRLVDPLRGMVGTKPSGFTAALRVRGPAKNPKILLMVGGPMTFTVAFPLNYGSDVSVAVMVWFPGVRKVT